MPTLLSLGAAAGRALERLAWRRVQAAVLPSTATALADAFADACASVDARLGCGFGDTLSSVLVGHHEDLNQLAHVLVAGDLFGAPDQALQALDAELDFGAYDEVSGTDTAAFLHTLMSELRLHVERRASGAGSPLANWYAQLQNMVVISLSRETRDTMAAAALARSTDRELSGGSHLVGQPWYVPVSRTPWFQGRAEAIAFLVDQPEGLTSGPPSSLSGLGGLGKTQTAVEFAHRHRGDFSAVFLVAAGTETTMRTGLADIAMRLGLASPNSRLDAELVALSLEWLDTAEGWLLIYDGADAPSLLAPYLPRRQLGRVIVTSRSACGELSGLGRCLRLESLSEADSANFLVARAQLGAEMPDSERAAAVELARLAGGLPLALEQMGAYLAESGAPIAQYLQALRARGVEQLGQSEARTGDYALSVTTTWSSDVEAVARDSPEAIEILRVSSFWSPERIPTELLVDGREGLSESVRDFPGLAEPLGVYGLLRPLQQYSLIQFDPGLRSFSLHPLLHETVRRDIVEGERLGYVRQAARALNAAFPSASFENWPLCTALVPHVQHVEPLIDLYDLDYEDVGAVLNEAASFLRIGGDYVLAEDMHLKTLELARASNSPGRVATSLNNLAFIYNDVDEPTRALPLFREALQLSEDDLGENHPDLWLAQHNLARTCLMVGLLDEAFELTERAIEIAPAETEDDVYFRAFIQVTRAEVLCALGRSDEALSDAEAALRTREQSGNPQRIAASLSTLGLVQRQTGDLDAAHASLRRAVDLNEAIYGANHPVLRQGLDRLAEVLRVRGRDDDAAEVEARSEALQRRLDDLWPRQRRQAEV